VFVSNNINSVVLFVNADIKRPSGETRGELSPSEFADNLEWLLGRLAFLSRDGIY
jgi:hypothetical protein